MNLKNKTVCFISTAILSTNIAGAATVNLNDGWNLVSIPSSGGSIDVSTLTYSSISTFNGTAPVSSRFISTVDTGKGYWIESSGSGTITYNEATSINIPEMNTGWNLVGFPSYNDITSFDDAMTNCGYTYTTISTFNGTAPVSSRFITTIDEQKGYWINITATDSDMYAQCLSGFNFNSTTGVGQYVFTYDGVTPTQASITLPEGTFDIYAEYTENNSLIRPTIGTIVKYEDNTTVDAGLIGGTGMVQSNAPAWIQIQNNTGSEQTYIFDVVLTNNNPSNYIAGDVWVAAIDNNETKRNYLKGGTLTLGDVETNVAEVLSLTESHNWQFDTNSTQGGTYNLSITTENVNSELNNPLENFNVVIKLGATDVMSTEFTDDGTITNVPVTLDDDIKGYELIIDGDTPFKDLGFYKIKLIKQ